MNKDYSGVIKIFLYSLTAWILVKGTQIHPFLMKPLPLFVFGVFTLCSHFLLFYFFILPPKNKTGENKKYSTKLLYYCCCVFSWSCMIDLIFFLELEGHVKGFMNFYLQNGESYFENSYGSLSLLLDFIYNLPMYLIIAFQIDNNIDCRNSVIFWAATMIVSLGTLQHGAFGGVYGDSIKPCTLMNIPYLILPPYILIDFMNKTRVVSGPVNKLVLTLLCIAFGIKLFIIQIFVIPSYHYYLFC